MTDDNPKVLLSLFKQIQEQLLLRVPNDDLRTSPEFDALGRRWRWHLTAARGLEAHSVAGAAFPSPAQYRLIIEAGIPALHALAGDIRKAHDAQRPEANAAVAQARETLKMLNARTKRTQEGNEG